jgi:UDP-N-acetylmuramate dehydrogenase
MRLHTTLHVGGPAEIWAEPRDIEELRGLLKAARESQLPVTVIGGGANLLVQDEGIPGLVIHLGHAGFQTCLREGNSLSVGAGLPIEWLIRRAEHEGLAGVEFLAGVPGRIGGAVRMNAGTHDDEGKPHSTSDVIRWIRTVDFDGKINSLPAADIGFEYRSSQLAGQIVVEALLELEPDDRKAISARVKKLWEYKKRTQDWSAPSAGCIFKNPKNAQAAGWLVDHAGMKGFQVGGAMVSAVHANFIINTGAAKAADVFELIGEVKAKVRSQFGVDLELEVQVLPREERR